MKYLVTSAVLALATVSTFAQVAPKPTAPPVTVPAVVDAKDRELALARLKLAIADAQIANATLQQAQQQIQPMEKQAQASYSAAMALMDTTKAALGYGPDYQWDYQAKDFVKKLQQPEPAAQPQAPLAPAKK